MKDWIKIQSFNKIHQAELRVDILKQNDIEAVIVNEKDSLFFFGEIDLYVKEEFEKKAKSLIDEFNGFAKVNSFVEKKPMLLFQKLLIEKGIEVEMKTRQDSRFPLENYELYVKNEKLSEVKEFVSEEISKDWQNIFKARKLRHALSIYTILENNNIATIITKEQNSEFHLKIINICVKNEDVENAKKIIEQLDGWAKVYENTSLSETEKKEKALIPENIKTLIINNDENFVLFVENSNKKRADELIVLNYEWVKLKGFSTIGNATYFKHILKSAKIQSVIINDKDSVFLLGEVELFVTKEDYDKAIKIIKDAK